jgi:hypothetical protein
MNTEQAKQLSEDALNRLMAALEQGHSAALKQYLAVMSRFRRYSWCNVLLIYSQLPQATHVGISFLVKARPARSQGRERDRDSCPAGRPQTTCR